MAIITISRELGSGGVLLGEELARRLGYRLLSRRGMVEAFEHYGLKIPLEKVEERMPGLVDRLFRLSKG
ncbi:MAG: cytidylate kinase family protein, partial [Nitrospinota bacterium]